MTLIIELLVSLGPYVWGANKHKRWIALNPQFAIRVQKVWISFHVRKSSVTSEIANASLFLDQENRLFYQHCCVCDSENSTLIGYHVTKALSVSSSLPLLIVAVVRVQMNPSRSRFSCLLSAICVDYCVFWCMNPIFCEFCFNLWTSMGYGMASVCTSIHFLLNSSLCQ